jgi:hypothetical protein
VAAAAAHNLPKWHSILGSARKQSGQQGPGVGHGGQDRGQGIARAAGADLDWAGGRFMSDAVAGVQACRAAIAELVFQCFAGSRGPNLNYFRTYGITGISLE